MFTLFFPRLSLRDRRRGCRCERSETHGAPPNSRCIGRPATLALLLALLVGHGYAAGARDVVLYVDAVRPGETRATFSIPESLRFRASMLGRVNLRSIHLRAPSIPDFEASVAASSLADDDHIVGIYIHGHGNLATVGPWSLFSPESSFDWPSVRERVVPNAPVLIRACQFVPADPHAAAVFVSMLAAQMGLEDGRVYAYFGSPSFLNSSSPRAVAYVYGGLALPLATYLTVGPGLLTNFATWYAAGTAAAFVLKNLMHANLGEKIAYEFALDDSFATASSPATSRQIRKAFFRQCEAALERIDPRD